MGNFNPLGSPPWRSVVIFDTDQRVFGSDHVLEKYDILFVFNGL